MTEEKTNGAAAAVEQPQQQVTLANVNGRLAELSELNALLTGRCSVMRGQLADKDAEIAALTQQVMRHRKDEELRNSKLALAKPERVKVGKH